VKVLITAVGGDLAQSALNCLRDSDWTGEIWGWDTQNWPAGRALVDQFRVAPPASDEAAYRDALEELVREEGIDVVVPLCEPEIRCLSRWHHEGRALPCRVLVNPWPEVERFSDKWLTTCHLRAQGIAVPAAACEPGAKAPGWPRVVKSRSGSGSSAVLVVHDLREEAEAFSRLAPALSQAFLPGEEGEYTAALFRWEGGQHHLVFRRLLGAGGMSREVHLVDVEPWRDWLLRVGEAIGASGSWNVQFRLREGQPLPFEINPRFSSTLYFRHVFGFQDLLWSLQPERIPTSFQSRFRRGVGVRGQIAHFFDLEEA